MIDPDFTDLYAKIRFQSTAAGVLWQIENSEWFRKQLSRVWQEGYAKADIDFDHGLMYSEEGDLIPQENPYE